MPIEPCYSLSHAARMIGVNRVTLKGWLEQSGLALPLVRHGSRHMIRESELKRVLEARAPHLKLGSVTNVAKRRRTA